jgi:GNAT superfamily N-acetyltransferase
VSATIATAVPADTALILSFIRELATFERLADSVEATEEKLRVTLFGPKPAAEVRIARWNADPAGFALFFPNYSTFLGQPGLYLEDLYVRPEFRGHGIGRALLADLARIGVARGCGRVEWSVLDWNEHAVGFYLKLGAVPMNDWTVFRLDRDALSRLAE